MVRPVEGIGNIPTTPHFSVIVEEKISYTDSYGDIAWVTVSKYYAFDNKSDWFEYIRYLYKKDMNRKDVFVGEVIPAKIHTDVRVSVEIPNH